MKTESLKVAVRVRPTLSIDSSVLGVVQIENNQIEIKDRGHFL